jgi:hypothetical protein
MDKSVSLVNEFYEFTKDEVVNEKYTRILNESKRSYIIADEFLTEEDIDFNESMFDKELLLDNNWYIVNDAGESKGICVPAIYEDGDVNWRWK